MLYCCNVLKWVALNYCENKHVLVFWKGNKSGLIFTTLICNIVKLPEKHFGMTDMNPRSYREVTYMDKYAIWTRLLKCTTKYPQEATCSEG